MSIVIARLRDRQPAVAGSIAPLRRAVSRLAARGGATDRQREDIALAVSEALTNAVTHAYAPCALPGSIVLHAALSADTLDVVVSDEGVGLPAPATSPRGGYGLAIIAQAVRGLQLSDATPGTAVRMSFAVG